MFGEVATTAIETHALTKRCGDTLALDRLDLGPLIRALVLGAFVWRLFGSLLGTPTWLVKLTPVAPIGFVLSTSFGLGGRWPWSVRERRARRRRDC